jgi:hypothetical protein
MYESAISKMRGLVCGFMDGQKMQGNLSLSHAHDHAENVARYGSVLGGYLAQKIGVDPEKVAAFTQIAGWSHDIVRYAAQGKSGEEESALLLEQLYDAHFKDLVSRHDYQRLVVDVVRNSEKSFSEMQLQYANDPEARAVALGIVAGDKLIETSGPRCLERRAFFVGKERMKNQKDLGAAFKYPSESPLGVLSETFVRLGHINHISNYDLYPEISALAQELHATQYQLYRGLIKRFVLCGTESEILDYIVGRMTPVPHLAKRIKTAGQRLVDEHHLDGMYFAQRGYTRLLEAINTMPHDEDLVESARHLIELFVTAKTPDGAIHIYEMDQVGPPTFRKWMNAIISYRKGDYAQKLLEQLQ